MTTRRDIIMYVGLATLLVGGLVVLFFLGPRWLTTPTDSATPLVPSTEEARKINARMFYVADDGEHLTTADREVPYGEGTTEQAKQIVEVALAPPPAPYVSAFPPGAKLKALFLTSKGEAYVDFTPEFQKNHPGGTTNEILTVYALVDTLTSNLPAISGVQILVDGKEIDTLAGHLDLRRPLEQNLTYANRQQNP